MSFFCEKCLDPSTQPIGKPLGNRPHSDNLRCRTLELCHRIPTYYNKPSKGIRNPQGEHTLRIQLWRCMYLGSHRHRSQDQSRNCLQINLSIMVYTESGKKINLNYYNIHFCTLGACYKLRLAGYRQCRTNEGEQRAKGSSGI